MIKMYNAEVLSKFPVVQHFPFGGLFSWDLDPNSSSATNATIHTDSQPRSSTNQTAAASSAGPTTSPIPTAPLTGAPRTQNPHSGLPPGSSRMPPPTAAPWAQARADAGQAATAAPWVTQPRGGPAPGMPMTAAPWAKKAPSNDGETG
jgi:serine/threonine-protein phosphatase 2A activator